MRQGKRKELAGAFPNAAKQVLQKCGPSQHHGPLRRYRGGFKVYDANGQSLAYVYSSENANAADMAGVLTARRIASNIAKLPKLLGKG